VRALLAALPFAAVARGSVASAFGSRSTRTAPAAQAPSAGGRVHVPSPRVFDELVGKRLGRCTVVRVDPIVAGAVPVTLRTDGGSEFEVDVLRHDPETPGVARAGSLAVFVNNGGSGDKATIEEHGLGAMALARWLEQREALGQPLPALWTLRQRAPHLVAWHG
jgi:hypothetical protein